MKHHSLKSFLFLFFICYTKILCQEVNTILERNEIKIDEEFDLTFEVNAFIVSFDIKIDDFTIVKGPKKEISSSIIKGKYEFSYKLIYTLKPQKPGFFTIPNPVFYSKNGKIIGKEINIKVIDKQLSDKELYDNKLKEFMKMEKKPKGTLRYIIKDNLGYIEVFGDSEWEFLRYLTKKEIEVIISIK